MPAETHVAYICQQCKQPLQLDNSLEELSPSAYDMIAGSLPQPQAPPPLSAAEKLARVPAPPAVKEAWASSQRPTQGRHLLSAEGSSQPANNSNPGESFVILQESVLQTPRSPVPSSTSPKSRPPKPSKRPAAAQGLSVDPPKVPDPVPQPQSPPAPRTHNLRSLHKLFELISSRTDVDHPLCSECTHALMDGLNKQLEEARKERDGYIAFEKEAKRELEKGRAVEEAEIERLDKLKDEEHAAIAELKAAEAELNKLNSELVELEEEEKALEADEANFWATHSSTQISSANLRTSLSSLRAAIRTSERELEALDRASVYNDVFCLGSDGVFGTINGLRLGRVGAVMVEWAEINAAWGQTCLLLYTLARKMNFTFENYTLHPMGSFSRITTSKGETYELYGSNEIIVTRFLHNLRFDSGMGAFLDCLRQITEHAKRVDPSLDFFYVINRDKIGDVSVKLQFNQEEMWTKAMRHILIVLKKLLKWVVGLDER